MSHPQRRLGARKLESWISEALEQDDNADESAVMTRTRPVLSSIAPGTARFDREGAEPIPSASVFPSQRPPESADFTELSGLLEGDFLESLRGH